MPTDPTLAPVPSYTGVALLKHSTREPSGRTMPIS